MPKQFWPAGDYWPLKVSMLKVNPTYDKSEIMIIRHLRLVPKWESLLFRIKKAPSIKQADLWDMFKGHQERLYINCCGPWPHLILRQVLQQ